QQVGSPFDVYNSPNNAFVARFIGSPAMNLVHVSYQNGVISNTNGLELEVSAPIQKRLEGAGYEGKEIIFGIRPEDIHTEQIALNNTPETMKIPRIILPEITGAKSILVLANYCTVLNAMVDVTDHNSSAQYIKIALNMKKAHCFDAETEAV